MDVIKDTCEEIFEMCNNNQEKEEILKECAKKKLLKIYNNENKEFEILLNKLEVAVDFNDYESVKRCVSKLMRLLNMNRKTLMSSIERLCI